jgi:hypothetical protein
VPLLAAFFAGARRYISIIASTFYPAGREALLRMAEARTQLQELAVEQKRLENETQRANNAIDLLQKIERIKDPGLRAKARGAILINQNILQLPDGTAS